MEAGTRIRVIGNKVLLKFLPWRHEGIVALPDKAKPQPVEAVIVAVGPRAHWALENGQKVAATRLLGEYFEIEDERYCVMADEGILVIDDEGVTA